MADAMLFCPSCRKQFRIPHYDPSSRYPCLNCGGTLSSAAMPGPAPLKADDGVPPEVVAAGADPSRRLGRFILVSELGSGAMGKVWKAWDNGLKRWVAVKAVSGGSVSMEDLARFRREAKVVAGLEHPNIATIYDIGDAQGRHFIVMRLIEGRTLEAEFRPSGGKLPDVAPVVAAMRDASRGVGYAHAHNVIHRDLKPANIMIDAARHVSVMDFGLAKSLNAPGVTVGIGVAFLGTPAFMAPEAARGTAREVDARTDVYALAASVWTLLAGRFVFLASTVQEQLLRAVRETAPSLRTQRPDVPEVLDAVLARALARAKDARYPDANAFADALEPFASAPASHRVLLVEDDEQIVPLVEQILEGEGQTVTHCGSGEAALAEAKRGGASLVLLDAGLPDVNGFELIARLRKIPGYEKTPIVMLTGAAAEDSVAKGFELGADDYVTKPFSPKILRARLSRFFKR